MGLLQSLKSSVQDLTPYFAYLLFVSTLGPFQFGYHLAELNAPLDIITCERKSIGYSVASFNLPQCIPMNSTEKGLISSIFTLGGLLGALGAGPVSARYGRLLLMRVTTAFFVLGPVGEALASNIPVMAGGRFVAGLGAGAALVAVPIYISEIAPPHQKGFFGAFTQISTNVGIFTTQLLGYFLSRGQMWRIILAVAGFIGVAQLGGLVFAVESPRWEAEHSQPRRAKEYLRRIRPHHINIEEEVESWSPKSARERSEEEETLLDNEDHVTEHEGGARKRDMAKQQVLGIFQVVFHPDSNRAILAVVLVMMAQQLCGINSIVMYGVSLLADLLKSNSALLNVLVSILNVVCTTGFAPLVDILGRKVCLLGSIAGMGVSSILLGAGIRSAIPALSAVSVLLFVGSFAFGLGPVPFILSTELVGPEAVGATQSWALAANWISTFVVAQFFPMVNERLGKGNVYFVFGGIAALFFFLVMWRVPETKGKKDVDEVWGRPARRED